MYQREEMDRLQTGRRNKKRKGKRRLKQACASLVCAALLLIQPFGGLNAMAQEPQAGTGGTAAVFQEAVSGQEADAQAQAEAHAAAWQQALKEYSEQLAAYHKALAAQEEAAKAATQQAAAAGQVTQQASEPQEEAAVGTETQGQPAGAESSAALPAESLIGKTVSILGDSISTYQGYIPEGYACFYPDPDNDITDVTQTWWMQVIRNTGMRLLVNGSYSASAVCGDSRAEDSSAGCSNRRIVDLMGADGTVPDVILVAMGVNDFFHSIELGSYSGTATYRTDHYIWDFTEGYELMLQKLQAVYPNSRIYCMTLLEANSSDHPRVNGNGNTVEDYNNRIKEIAAAHGIPVIDVHDCGMEVYELNQYTSDGTHPNRAGAARMAAYVTNALLTGG